MNLVSYGFSSKTKTRRFAKALYPKRVPRVRIPASPVLNPVPEPIGEELSGQEKTKIPLLHCALFLPVYAHFYAPI
jgi:hypothetical protein